MQVFSYKKDLQNFFQVIKKKVFKQVFQAKKVFKNFFSGNLYLRKPKRRSLQTFRKVSGVFQQNFNGSKIVLSCVPYDFLANQRVPNFFKNNCAQSSKKMFMCPKFCTNPVIKYTKCQISTNFLKLHLLYCQNLFPLAPTNRRFTEKNRFSGNTGAVLEPRTGQFLRT